MKNQSRRNFVTAGIAATVASTVLPACQPKVSEPVIGKPELPIIGHGDFTYRIDKTWGDQEFNKIPVNNCHEMVQDSKGRLIMVTDHAKNNVVIYDRSGKVIKTWTGNWNGTHGLTVHNEGGEDFLYITDSENSLVVKTTMDGKILMTFGMPKENSGYTKPEEFKPTETAIGPNGDIYIADGYGQNFITQYSAKGEYIRHFGGKGEGVDQFDCCHGITVDSRQADPTLLITSRSKQEFKRFTMDGKHIETIPTPGCWICRPVIKGDNLYFAVIVTKNWFAYDGMVAIFDKNNKLVSMPGGSAPVYKDGTFEEPTYDNVSFLNPHDVCIDDDENIYVPQWYSGKTYPVKLERVG